MNELIDEFLFELFDGLRDKTTVLLGEFIADAQALAANMWLAVFADTGVAMICVLNSIRAMHVKTK